MTEWLDMLKEYADSVEEIHSSSAPHKLMLQKDVYLDNGYGYYFTSNIVMIIDPVTEDIEELTIDGETREDLEKRMDELIKQCLWQEIFNECHESFYTDDPVYEIVESQLRNNDEQNERCGECEQITMKQGWIEVLEGGGCW